MNSDTPAQVGDEPWMARVQLRWALQRLMDTPGVWLHTAQDTRGDSGGEDGSYGKGLARGIELAVTGFTEPLAALLAALPDCEHGIGPLTRCPQGCG